MEIKQGILSGLDLEGYKAFFDVPYASDLGRFKKAGEAPSWGSWKPLSAVSI